MSKKKYIPTEDVTKFDPNFNAHRQLISYIRKSYLKYPSDVSSHALTILEALETNSNLEKIIVSSQWLIKNVSVGQIGNEKFVHLFFVLAGLLNDFEIINKIDQRFAEIARDFYQTCEGIVDEEAFHYNIANAFFEISEAERENNNYDSYLENHREGRHHLKRCLKINPAKPEAIANLANSFNAVGRDIEAIEICDEAIRFKADHQMAYSLKGEILVKLAFIKNQVLDAIHCLETAWNFPTKTSRVAYNLGQAYIKLGEIEKAKFFFRSAVELANDSSLEAAKWHLAALEGQKK